MTAPVTTTIGWSGMTPIRVPAKVVNVWRDEMGWYCALDDGRVYERVFDKWHPLIGAVEDR